MASVIERTLRGGAGFLSASLCAKGLGLVFVLVASKSLGASEYGIFALSLSAMFMVQNLGKLGLPTVVQKLLSGQGERNRAEILSVVLLGGTASALIAGLALYFLAPIISNYIFTNASLIPVLRILSAGLVLALFGGLLRSLLQSQEKVGRIVVADFLRDTSKILVFLALILFLSSTATAAAWAVVISSSFGLLVLSLFLFPTKSRPKFPVSSKVLGLVTSYAAPFALVGFGYLVAHQMDRLMLGVLSDSTAVGIYAVVSSVAAVSNMAHGALVPIFLPIASSAHREGRWHEVRTAYSFTASWASYPSAVLLIIFLGFGRWILGTFGRDYSTLDAVYVLLALGVASFLTCLVGPTGALLQMSGGHRLESFNTLIFVAANFGLNLLLIPRYGILGAAVATLTSGVLRNLLQVVQLYLVHSFFPISLEQLRPLLPVLALFGFAAGSGFAHPALPVVASLALACLIFLFLKGLSAEERTLMHSLRLKLAGVKPPE